MEIEKSDYLSSAVIMRVFKRDRFLCSYCGVNGSEAELQCDHIIPKSKGGSNHMSNLATSCRKCNQSKGNRNIMQPNTKIKGYYFKYESYTYKLESMDITSLLATVIDSCFEEYETVFLNDVDVTAIKFWQDKEKFLAWLWGSSKDAKEWMNQITPNNFDSAFSYSDDKRMFVACKSKKKNLKKLSPHLAISNDDIEKLVAECLESEPNASEFKNILKLKLIEHHPRAKVGAMSINDFYTWLQFHKFIMSIGTAAKKKVFQVIEPVEPVQQKIEL
jgi:hypothetical protein